MDDSQAELHRRRWLIRTATSVGGIGVVASSVPFLESMLPSEQAKAAGAPVTVDVTHLAPGALLTEEWRGRPVWILHRTDAMLHDLDKHDSSLQDPQSLQLQQPAYAKNPTRSIKSRYLVLIGICTHLGCIPGYRPDVGATDLGADWTGGFYCPCHGSKFDLAGRVEKNVPAPLNLEVPPHRYLSDTVILIGAD